MNRYPDNEPPIVLVDDETDLLFSLSMVLTQYGFRSIVTLHESRELLPYLEQNRAAVILLDLLMPHLKGTELLPHIIERFPHIPVVVMTATHDLETAVSCMKMGAFDYLVKPAETNRIVSTIRHALEVSSLRQQVGSLKHYLISDQLENAAAFESIITQDRRMRALFQYTESAARSPEPILVCGETGTGKELIVKAIHTLSQRPGPFISVNAAGLDDTMFSDTLFGHRKGAYTGAHDNRGGLIAQAVGGTLFLDEVGDLPLASQIKLLRLLQEHQYYPLGSDMPKQANVRVVVATNQDLQQQIKAGLFRADLYYRLASHRIDLPPLRERKGDITLLLHSFLTEASKTRSIDPPVAPVELVRLLSAYHYPGNIRELRAMIFDAVTQHRGGPALSMEYFRKIVNLNQKTPPQPETEQALGTWFSGRMPTLKEAEELLIQEALRRGANNQGTAATLLGISRQALNKRLVRTRGQGDG